jgi:hypothetical protein
MQNPRGDSFLISFVGLKIQVFEQDTDLPAAARIGLCCLRMTGSSGSQPDLGEPDFGAGFGCTQSFTVVREN